MAAPPIQHDVDSLSTINSFLFMIGGTLIGNETSSTVSSTDNNVSIADSLGIDNS